MAKARVAPAAFTASSVEAFAKPPAGTVESLLADPATLTEVPTYHVVSGRMTAADAAGLSSAPTVEGSELPISTDDGVHVGDVVTADIEAGNGLIHVIERVLLPAAA
ncbi:MAG TPA: fasciclin domain-containing protein [Gaiellaceae bacterium]|nr:fasciclin domain-containing protein [Gaiellaceae bacterium]